MSKFRTTTRTVGDKVFHLDCELIQITTPDGTVPTVRITYAHNGMLYASVPLAHLPEDIQGLFA